MLPANKNSDIIGRVILFFADNSVLYHESPYEVASESAIVAITKLELNVLESNIILIWTANKLPDTVDAPLGVSIIFVTVFFGIVILLVKTILKYLLRSSGYFYNIPKIANIANPLLIESIVTYTLLFVEL